MPESHRACRNVSSICSGPVSADQVLPRDWSSTFPLSLPVANISFDSPFVHFCQCLYVLPFHSPWFVKVFQAEAQYQPVALPSEFVHPVLAPLALAKVEAGRRVGPLNTFLLL